MEISIEIEVEFEKFHNSRADYGFWNQLHSKQIILSWICPLDALNMDLQVKTTVKGQFWKNARKLVC